MARFLVSLNTGVVLPFCEAALKSPGVRELSPDEATAYEASVAAKTVEPMDVTPPAAEPLIAALPETVEVVPEEVVPEVVEAVSVVTSDIADGEPDVEAVLGALESE